jgi:hypothetical protein
MRGTTKKKKIYYFALCLFFIVLIRTVRLRVLLQGTRFVVSVEKIHGSLSSALGTAAGGGKIKTTLTKELDDDNSIPYAMQGNVSSKCKVNTNLTELVAGIGLGWEGNGTPPDWMNVLCPEVVDHFNEFPLFNQQNVIYLGRPIAISTTNYAAQSVCTAKIVKLLARSIQARIYLHAGSQLGAVRHGQPVST